MDVEDSTLGIQIPRELGQLDQFESVTGGSR